MIGEGLVTRSIKLNPQRSTLVGGGDSRWHSHQCAARLLRHRRAAAVLQARGFGAHRAAIGGAFERNAPIDEGGERVTERKSLAARCKLECKMAGVSRKSETAAYLQHPG
jgi:hypothetical protein